MRQLRGNVRYRFRSDDHDVNVIIEGASDWVQKYVDELGLEGVGWTMPIGTEVKATNLSSVSRKRQEAGINIEMDDAPADQRPADMGPEPDPSRIPVVRRPIGELNLQEIESSRHDACRASRSHRSDGHLGRHGPAHAGSGRHQC